jgi:hypothetical protein
MLKPSSDWFCCPPHSVIDWQSCEVHPVYSARQPSQLCVDLPQLPLLLEVKWIVVPPITRQWSSPVMTGSEGTAEYSARIIYRPPRHLDRFIYLLREPRENTLNVNTLLRTQNIKL